VRFKEGGKICVSQNLQRFSGDSALDVSMLVLLVQGELVYLYPLFCLNQGFTPSPLLFCLIQGFTHHGFSSRCPCSSNCRRQTGRTLC